MANSDIILENDGVQVKGELKVDSISLSKSNTRAGAIEIKSQLTFPRNGALFMRNADGARTVRLTANGDLMLGGTARVNRLRVEGAVRGGDISGRSLRVREIQSQQISLGAAGNDEGGGTDGKITMLNSAGSQAIVIDAARATITVAGVGDLVGQIRQLITKVKQLETKIERLQRRPRRS